MDVIALADKQCRSHGAIDSSAHTQQNRLSCHRNGIVPSIQGKGLAHIIAEYFYGRHQCVAGGIFLPPRVPYDTIQDCESVEC